MKAFVLGTADDVRAFALAGVAGIPCETARDVEDAALLVAKRADLGLLLVSEPVRALAPAAIESLSPPRGPPAVVVLP